MKLPLRTHLVLALFVLAACAKLGPPPGTVAPPELATLTGDRAEAANDEQRVAVFDRARSVFGGKADAARVRTVEILRIQYSSGQSTDRSHGPEEVARTRARIAWAPEQREIVASFRHRPIYPYPFPAPFSFDEHIVADSCGWIDGADEFQGVRKRTLTAGRAAMREKQRFVSTPYEIVRAAAGAGTLHRVGDGWEAPFVWRDHPMTARLADTGRLEALEYVEDDPLLGDIEVRVRFRAWKETAFGTTEPSEIVHEVDGKLVQVDRIVSRTLQGPVVAKQCQSFELPDTADIGRLRARWQMDWIGVGFPQDDVATTAKLEIETVAEGIHLVGGAFHNALIVELGNDELVLSEAPFSVHRVEAIFAEIEKRWPQARVVAATQSHWHYDHNSGVRAVVARGIPIYAGPSGGRMVEEVAARPRTRKPDRLSANPVPARVITVTEPTIIKGSVRSVELLPVDTVHVEDMLIAYVPEEKLLLTSDLINPGLLPTRGAGGWIFRTVIKAAVPFSMIKAGTYAQDLTRVFEQRDVEKIVGGHGPDVNAPRDAQTLAKHADRDRFLKILETNGQVD